MPNYAVIQRDRIVNVIVASSRDIAKEVTGCEVIETSGTPWAGWERVDGEWIEPSKTEDAATDVEGDS